MLNRYEVHGDESLIHLINGGVTVIDTADLHIALNFKGSWRLVKSGNRCYVMGYTKDTGSLYLHRHLLNCPKGFVVDHIDGNGLNNVRSNIRIVTQAENLQNLQGAKVTSRSGTRNVFYDSYFKKWVAEVSVNGKVVFKKRFTHRGDAELSAELGRAKYQPYSPEGTAMRQHYREVPAVSKFTHYDLSKYPLEDVEGVEGGNE